MTRTLLAIGTVFVFTLTVFADADKDAGKRSLGAWKRMAGDNTITFEFKADVLRATIAADGNTIEAEADYGITKDGVIFGRISKVAKKGTEEGPAEGDLFSFRIKVDKDTAVISDLKTHNDNAQAQQLIQGEYKKENK